MRQRDTTADEGGPEHGGTKEHRDGPSAYLEEEGPAPMRTSIFAASPAPWCEASARGFLAEALTSGDGPEVYKAAIKFAAQVRRTMTAEECKRASVELILEADADTPEESHQA